MVVTGEGFGESPPVQLKRWKPWTRRRLTRLTAVVVALGALTVAAAPTLGALNERQWCNGVYNSNRAADDLRTDAFRPLDKGTFMDACLADREARRTGPFGIFHTRGGDGDFCKVAALESGLRSEHEVASYCRS